jgi:helicase MOV-10
MDVHRECHLLVCAPSNSAADLLALRLSARYTPRQLLRLNAPSRSYDSLPVQLRKYSKLEGTFTSPSKDELMKFKIVVSTCYYASVPRALGIQNHFTHIFIDEAGHASEPEIMIPILQNISRETNVILSGDVCIWYLSYPGYANALSAKTTGSDYPVEALHSTWHG